MDPASALRSNGELSRLRALQIGSIIGGSALVATGFTLFVIKWARGGSEPDSEGATVSGAGIAPTSGGGSLEIGGRF